jgi:hypothetical protein
MRRGALIRTGAGAKADAEAARLARVRQVATFIVLLKFLP